ncbi:phosphatase PAP2 family protein [Aerococcus kribbianus]|uniref:Phosphatase PAP2 family protein n=1 Tax=Aerococcus kribbianus TaxID=2999064 RepID=A0A9X3JEJ3_9LACT|nr:MULTISPECIES: phosphatase PAP2 family protein [unclassified Aerococcus]MCZ0717214.1 phosphatase PAP2 family protein [Aerococcus sp. YH-aer221]MCZ0725502.1 phosphatase PAP2 family protein [Aerococcus sp. YH-aer222]
MTDYYAAPFSKYFRQAAIAVLPFIIIVTLAIAIPDRLQSFDENLLLTIYNSGGPLLDQIVTTYTDLAGPQTITVLTILLWLTYRYYLKKPRVANWFVVTVVIAFGILNSMVKYIVMRPRPSVVPHLIEQGGFSFPSGHSCGSMIFYGALAVLLFERYKDKKWGRRLAGFVLTFFPITIALSRLYLGVHYPSDTVAGLSLGATTLIIATAYLRNVILIEEENDLNLHSD